MLANLSSQQKLSQDFSDIIKLIQRKNRMVEIGQFAAVFLQSHIRKLLAKLRVYRLLLQRFEYVPSTRKKKEFFVDTLKRHKWTRLPHLLKNEPPGSPRTINRRLVARDRKGELRMERFMKIMSEKYNLEEDLFDQEDQHIAHLRQFVIFRDVVAVAMRRLAAKEPAALEDRSDGAAPLIHRGFRAVRMSMTAPVMSPRQLGILMVRRSGLLFLLVLMMHRMAR